MCSNISALHAPVLAPFFPGVIQTMIIALVALAALCFQLFAIHNGLYLDEQIEGAYALLWLFVAFEGILMHGRIARASVDRPAAPAAPSDDGESERLRSALEKTKENLSQLAASHKEASERSESLKVALSEAQSRLAKLQDSQTSISRDDTSRAEIVSFLSLLQDKGRFVDFLMDDVTAYSDAQVGAAARVVHQGCRSVLLECFDITQVHKGEEGQKVSLEKDFSASEYRIVGKVAGNPPFRGTLLHRGWKANKVELPRLIKDSAKERTGVIAPAEVEIN